ncbi:MAG: TIGR03085 family metal-binding protein [Actinomycetes bacterium]
MSTHNFAQDERSLLCDLFEEVGPDAPTLCDGWTTRDLAAHLVVRERRPDAALGILAPPLASYGERVRVGVASTEWEELVDQVRTGPPMLSIFGLPGLDRMANTMEYFIHHEDVSRAQPKPQARELPEGLQLELWNLVKRMSKLLLRRAPVGVELLCTNSDSTIARAKTPLVTVTGSAGELALFIYGRQSAAEVELVGSDADVAALRAARFSI